MNILGFRMASTRKFRSCRNKRGSSLTAKMSSRRVRRPRPDKLSRKACRTLTVSSLMCIGLYSDKMLSITALAVSWTTGLCTKDKGPEDCDALRAGCCVTSPSWARGSSSQ